MSKQQASLDVLLAALQEACAGDLVLRALKKEEIEQIARIFFNNRFQETRKYAQSETSDALNEIVDRILEKEK